jgi:7-cyano-7-deazaguanine synthase
MTHAIVLLSGGIDSATCLAVAVSKHKHVTPIHYDYGQQTADLEERRARKLTQHFQEHITDTEVDDLTVVDYRSVFGHFAGGVASDRDSFVTEDGELEEEDGRSTGFVPMRNLHLIATGSAFADVQGANYVYHGAQMGDEAAYPDCRPEFMGTTEKAVNYSMAPGQNICLMTPLIQKTKREVIQKGEQLGVPWQYTYSCYEEVDDLEEPQPCGECPACVERSEAFESADVTDPIGTVDAAEEKVRMEET